MPASALQSSARLVQTADANPIPAPSGICVFALTVGDVASAALAWTAIAGYGSGNGFRVVDFWCVKTGGAAAHAHTAQLRDGAGNAISDALNMNVADQTVVRAATIDDARHAIAAGGGLQVNHVKAGASDASYIAYVAVAFT